MSHFVFGVVEGIRMAARQRIADNIDVCWGAEFQQSVVMEMLNQTGKPDPAETPYCLVSTSFDNADGLISPYQVDRSLIIENLSYIFSWLDRERADKAAEIWITEGYDDQFDEIQGSCQDLGKVIERALADDGYEVPSLRLILQAKPVQSGRQPHQG